uniref:Uncharacterized protein n=1 Tax=Rhizophora mucronata TaxID=61149 RepID=A0A2P2PZR8_RHIMU
MFSFGSTYRILGIHLWL